MRNGIGGLIGCSWIGLFACVAISTSANANGKIPQLQELQQLTKQTVIEYRAGRKDVAVALSKKIALGAKLRFGERHIRYAQALNNWALFQGWNGNLKGSESNFRMAIKVVQDLPGNQSGQLSELFNNLAWVTLQNCQIREAQSLYAKAFDMTSKYYGDHHPKTVMVRGNIKYLDRYFDNSGPTKATEPQSPQAKEMAWIFRRCMS